MHSNACMNESPEPKNPVEDLLHTDILELIRRIPHARIHYPDGFSYKTKYFFWKLYRPFHPFLRDLGIWLRVVRHTVSRQPFLLGTVDLVTGFKPLLDHLLSLGFAAQSVAWKDDGEIASLSLPESFVFQYHIRVFDDGEVRAHYEHTPEAHPIRHMLEIEMKPAYEEFRRMIGDRITWIV